MPKDEDRGKRVKQAMESNNKKVTETAHDLGLAHGTLSAISNGREFSTFQLKIVCDLLNVTASEIMCDHGITPEEIELLHHFRNHSEQSRQTIVTLLKNLPK